MAARPPKPAAADTPLGRLMREFEHLVRQFEVGLLRSLHDEATPTDSPSHVRRQACQLAIADLGARYARKHIQRSLAAAEAEGKRLEDQLGTLARSDEPIGRLHNGYFRLYSTELFDLLGQPTDLRFGTLRFHRQRPDPASPPSSLTPLAPLAPPPAVDVELALNSSFFVADSLETLPYHTFRLPATPSLQNRGILSRKPDDCGAFPAFDSWLLFTFLGRGCIKLEVPVEMCADIYGGRLAGRENDEVLFWGFFVDDDVE